MKIKSGELEILSSGVIFTNESNTLNFNLDPELILTFKFINDIENPTSQVQYRQSDANSGEITLVNYNDYTGRGILAPLKIGTIKNKEIYIIYWVTKLNPIALGKKFEYTFYIK